MKNFFGIDKNFQFEVDDLSALLTICNVLFIILGYNWARYFSLANSAIMITYMSRRHAHINFYLIQLSLITLNLYFLLS